MNKVLIWAAATAALSISTRADAAAPGPHARHAEIRPIPARSYARILPPPTQALVHKAWVYGYLPYWGATPEKLAWDKLTHVAIFDVGLAADGSLKSKHHWTNLAPAALALAAPYGVRVHLTLTSFDASVMKAVLPSAALRSKVVAAIGDLVDAQGGHGVSVDFEGMPQALKGALTAFVTELSQRVPEVTVAIPAVDWNKAYDITALSAVADALFVMGYDYHWKGSNPGPVAPLYGGGTWNAYSLDWSVDRYTDPSKGGTTPDKLVLGLPLYGYRWPSLNNDVPGKKAAGTTTAVLMADGIDESAQCSAHYDDPTETPYYFPNTTSQVWYDHHDSISAKIDWALDQGLLGVGFWALGYEGGDPDFWDMVGAHTQSNLGDVDIGISLPDSAGGEGGAPVDDAADEPAPQGEGGAYGVTIGGEGSWSGGCTCSLGDGAPPAGLAAFSALVGIALFRRRRRG